MRDRARGPAASADCVIPAWITRNRTLDPNAPVVYSCGRGRAPNLEPRVDPFGVEQFYPADPTASASAAIAYMTMVNGSHAWPLTGSDPTGRGLVTHDVERGDGAVQREAENLCPHDIQATKECLENLVRVISY